MKKHGVDMVFLLFFLTGCLPLFEYEPVPRLTFSSNAHVFRWVAGHVDYVSDQVAHGLDDWWQDPTYTYKYYHGDCEDHAILAMHFLVVEMSKDPLLIIGEGHAYVFVDNTYWDAVSGLAFPEPDIEYTMDFREVLQYLTYQYVRSDL